jgi:hypothetical protein
MTVRVKKNHPALKHGGFSVTALLPGEDPAAFEKLYQDLIAELQPDGPSENETIGTIARLMWRKQNLETFRIAEAARKRYSAIRSAKVPSTTPPYVDFPLLSVSPDWIPPDPAEVKAAMAAAEAQARKELGPRYIFVEMGEEVTISKMFEDLEVEERLDAMIHKQFKQLLFLKGLKSLPSMTPSTRLPGIEGPKKA